MSDSESAPDDASTDGRSTADRQRGPWFLALGALAIGVLAFLVSGARALLRRVRRR